MGWLDSTPKDKDDCKACGGRGTVNGGLGNQAICNGCGGSGKK